MKNKLLIAAFLEGFLLLAFELISAQLLHPIYGNSYFVWIGVLAITMLASALGYFLGGYITTLNNDRIKTIAASFLVGLSLFSLSLYTINNKVFSILYETDFITATLLQTSCILLIPVVLTTSFSPIIIKFYAQGSAGKSSSSIFFASTIGGIVSIYSIAFIILPSIDLILFIKLISLLITILVVILNVSLKKHKLLMGHVLLSIFIFTGLTKNQKEVFKGKNTEVIYRAHGIMGEIEVREEHNSRRYISSNRTTQSAIQKSTGKSLWSYPYRVSTYASLAPENGDVLVAGLGGGILVNQLIDLNFNIDCIEFDRRMIGVAKKYMGLRSSANIKIDDFRHYINYSDKKYDLIVLDLSKGESLPTNVYTVEAFKKMSTMLKPNGFIILHYFSNVYGSGDFGLHSIMKTMERAGCFFAFVKKNENDKNPEQLLIASNQPQIIPATSKFRIPLQSIQNFGFVYNDFLDKTIDYSTGTTLYDGNNALEKLQLQVVKDIRDRLRLNEKKTFFE